MADEDDLDRDRDGSSDDLDAEDDLDQDQADPDDDGMGIFRQALDQSARPAAATAPSDGLLDNESAAAVDKTAGMSKHEREQQRMQKRIAQLEAQNMAEKDWFMQGESAAGEPTCLVSSQPVMLVCLTELHGLSIWMLLPNPVCIVVG